MSTTADPLVVVCRDPRDRQRARVRLSKLHGFAFDGFSDGSRVKFARAMLVAYLDPADVEDGEIFRPISAGPAPIRIKVAIPRTQNQAVYPIIERAAAAHRIAQLASLPRRRTRLNPPQIPQSSAGSVSCSRGAPAACPPDVPTVIDVVALRARTGLSPTAFAARIGVKTCTLFSWEVGRRVPRAASRERLSRIEQALHLGATR